MNTLKVLIFAGTYFRGNLFSREFIFAIGIFDYFAVTYFREFREFTNFHIFRDHLFSRISRFIDFLCISRELIFAKFAVKTFFGISQETI